MTEGNVGSTGEAEPETLDFDAAVAQAWERFGKVLVDHLRRDGRPLWVTLHEEYGDHPDLPAVHLLPVEQGFFVGIPRNPHVVAPFRLSLKQLAVLRSLLVSPIDDWRRYVACFDHDQTGPAVRLVTTYFRDLLGIPDPSFLDLGPVGDPLPKQLLVQDVESESQFEKLLPELLEQGLRLDDEQPMLVHGPSGPIALHLALRARALRAWRFLTPRLSPEVAHRVPTALVRLSGRWPMLGLDFSPTERRITAFRDISLDAFNPTVAGMLVHDFDVLLEEVLERLHEELNDSEDG